MRSKHLQGFYVLAILLTFVLLGACRPTGDVVSDGQSTQDALFTAAVETIQAGYQQSTAAAGTQAAMPEPATSTPLPSPTSVPPTPTITPTNTSLPTATRPAAVQSPAPQATATQPAAGTAGAPPAGAPLVSAIINTNCRAGPGSEFEITGRLNVGQPAEVVGRDRFGVWWYIQNPGQPGQFCWVWSGSTQVAGDTSQMPVITPTPVPTSPATGTPGSTLEVSFSAVRSCEGVPTALFQVTNAGSQRLDSLNLQIDDLTGGDRLFGPSASDAPFMGSTSECPPGGDALEAGWIGYIGGSLGSPAPSGNTARASVRLCTQNGLAGTCTDRSVEFTIP